MDFILTAMLLILGGVLLACGINSTESFQGDLHRLASMPYDDRTVWLIVSGAVCFLLGLVELFHRRRA
jgi:hypothetical protein